MDKEIRIRRLQVNDAPLLKNSKAFLGSLSNAEDKIRSVIFDKSKYPYVATDSDGNMLCIAIFVPRFPVFTNYDLYLEFKNETCQDTEIASSVLSKLLYKAFFEKKMHKVSIVIAETDSVLDEAAKRAGMIQEAILGDEILIDGKYVNAGLFSCVLPEYSGYNVAFVPFQRGVAAVYGSDTYVDKVSLFHYGEKIEDYLADCVADYIGILDDEKRLLPRNSAQYSDLDDTGLPSEVAKACNELREYFHKNRSEFDINIKFDIGTDFQHSVWYSLMTIPYGATVSYEDIALKLTDNDPIEARKLTRAVGAACSDNPVQVIVPCHRVIGKNGKLIGYSGGVDLKDFLLQHESIFLTLI